MIQSRCNMNRDILVYYSTKPFDCAALGSQDAMSQDVIWRRMLGCKGWAALSAGYPRDIFRQFGTQEAKTQTRGLNRCGVRDIGTPGSRAQFRKEVVRCDAGPIACCLTPDKEPTIELSAPSEYVLGRLRGTVLTSPAPPRASISSLCCIEYAHQCTAFG